MVSLGARLPAAVSFTASLLRTSRQRERDREQREHQSIAHVDTPSGLGTIESALYHIDRRTVIRWLHAIILAGTATIRARGCRPAATQPLLHAAIHRHRRQHAATRDPAWHRSASAPFGAKLGVSSSRPCVSTRAALFFRSSTADAVGAAVERAPCASCVPSGESRGRALYVPSKVTRCAALACVGARRGRSAGRPSDRT